MIVLNNLSMGHGNKLLFTEVNLKLNKNCRYALVGANGTGKSTLFKLITKTETPTEGDVGVPKHSTIGWLKQDQFKYEDTKILDIVLQGKVTLWEAMQKKEELLCSAEFTEEIGYKLAELEEVIAHNDGYTAESQAITILKGLGIEEKYHNGPLNALSGGYKLRVLLAQTLFADPDILLLDEPTNHLDILSINWLEKYLKSEFRGLLLLISHDVSFINKIADYILDIDYGDIRQYSGNYNKFLTEKKDIDEQIRSQKRNVEEKIADMQQFVDKFKAKASKAKQAQSKLKQIGKLEVPDMQVSSRIAPRFNFELSRPSGKQVLTANNLAKSFGDKQVFNKVSLSITRGEKVAIVGVNGVGKSTLIKTLLDKVKADKGEYEWGVETHINYFSQDHHEELKDSQTVLAWLLANAPKKTMHDVRKVLGLMLFSKSTVDKNILSISGGEAARLLLAKLMLNPGNILVLDEPTNHMDIESIFSLSKSLQEYKGTLLLVSHNQDLLENVANRIIFVKKDKVVDFHGKYGDFLAKYVDL
tara:strand:- start:385 stop:1977 length:1593 start_codon:yes stop_codon:yes gene_type:complete